MIDKVATCGYFARMRNVGIKALKDNLSAYIKEVEAGATVLVTDRGRVVARLVPEPKAPNRPLTQEEILDQLEREGRLTRAKNPKAGPPQPLGTISVPERGPERVPFDELMRQLDADREDR